MIHCIFTHLRTGQCAVVHSALVSHFYIGQAVLDIYRIFLRNAAWVYWKHILPWRPNVCSIKPFFVNLRARAHRPRPAWHDTVVTRFRNMLFCTASPRGVGYRSVRDYILKRPYDGLCHTFFLTFSKEEHAMTSTGSGVTIIGDYKHEKSRYRSSYEPRPLRLHVSGPIFGHAPYSPPPKGWLYYIYMYLSIYRSLYINIFVCEKP